MDEKQIETELMQRLSDRKYICRADIQNREALEQNFREKFEELNQIQLTDNEFEGLLEQIVNANVFQAYQSLREHNRLVSVKFCGA